MSGSGNDQALTTADIQALERRSAQQEADLREAREETARLRADVDQLRAMVRQLAEKSATTCKKCGTAYDLFSHHYSIGLFDNIVYVKCPQCQTAMPVDPRHGVRKE